MNHIVWSLQMRLSRGPVDHPDNTYKQKQNAYKSRCGCERVKPNNSSDKDTDLDEWLKEIKHLSSFLLVRTESRDGNKDRLQMLLHIVASATQRRGWGGWWGHTWVHSLERAGPGDESVEVNEYVQYSILWHAASPVSHTLPSALGWKRMFGSLGQPRSPARGGKEALTECEAVPLCRPQRTSHLGVRGEGTQPTSLSKYKRR